jgi:hypothetical protein
MLYISITISIISICYTCYINMCNNYNGNKILNIIILLSLSVSLSPFMKNPVLCSVTGSILLIWEILIIAANN